MANLTSASEDEDASCVVSRLGFHPMSAFIVAAVFGMGVALSWYTGAGIIVPVALFVVASALVVAGEVAFYP